MASIQNNILHQGIASLNFSADFKAVSASLGFITINDIAQHHISALLEMDGFTYHMLQEFVQFMQQNGLSGNIKQH